MGILMVKRFLFLGLLFVSANVMAASADRDAYKSLLDTYLYDAAPVGSFIASEDNALRKQMADKTVYQDELQTLVDPFIDSAVSGIGSANTYTPTDNTCATDMTAELEAFLTAHDGQAMLRKGDCILLGNMGSGIKNTEDIHLDCPVFGGCTVKYNRDKQAILYHPVDTTVLSNQTAISAITTANINIDDMLQRLSVASVTGYSIGDFVKIHDSVPLPSRVDSATSSSTVVVTGVAWDAGNAKCVVTAASTDDGDHDFSATTRVMLKDITGTVTSKIDYLDGSDGYGRTYNITLGDGAGASTTTKFTLQTLDNATDSTTGTDVNCDTGTYTSGGVADSNPGWVGEASQVVGIDATNKYIFLAAPLQYPLLYAQSPQLYKYTKNRKFSVRNIKFTANGDTSDISYVGDALHAIDIRGVPEAKFDNVLCDNTWAGCIIHRSSPMVRISNLYSLNLPNRQTNNQSSQKTITGITAANPTVFTSNSHGFSNNNVVYLENMPSGYTAFNNKLCLVTNKTTNDFQCRDTYLVPFDSSTFGAFLGLATSGEVADVNALGYGYSEYGAAYGSKATNITCLNGRHCRTSDAQTGTWSAVLTSGSSIIQKGMPTYTTLDGALSIGSYGVPFDTHEEDAEASFKNIRCIAPGRGAQFGSYEGRCLQIRGKRVRVDGFEQYGGTGGMRIVATNHEEQPEYWFNNIDIRDLTDVNDNLSATQSAYDSIGIYIADTNSSFITQDNTNTFKPKIHLSNARFEGMFSGIVGETDAQVYAQNVVFKDVTQPVYARPGTNFEFETVYDDRRDTNVTLLGGTHTGGGVAIGTGSKSFTTQTGGRYRVGMTLLAYSAADPLDYMLGQITSYDTATGALVANITEIGTSGTNSDYVLQGDFPTFTLGSDADDGGATVRVNNIHTLKNRAVPSVLFGEIDTTATKYYAYSRWNDQNNVTTKTVKITNPVPTSLTKVSDADQVFDSVIVKSDAAEALTVRQVGSDVNAFNVDASIASLGVGLNILPQTAASDFVGIGCTSPSDSTCSMQLRGLGATSRLNIDPDGDGDTQFLYRAYQFSMTPDTNGTAGTADISYTAPADTTLTASTDAPLWKLDFSAIREHSTGALSTQRDFWILNSNHSAVGVSTITDAVTLYLQDAPIAGANVTMTNRWSLWADDGIGRFDDGLITKYPLTVLNTGGTASTPALATESNRLYTNTGATALTNITLPSASVTDGSAIISACVVDADGIKITAQAGDYVYAGSSPSTSGGYIQSTTLGSCVQLVVLDTTNWMALSLTGTWAAF